MPFIKISALPMKVCKKKQEIKKIFLNYIPASTSKALIPLKGVLKRVQCSYQNSQRLWAKRFIIPVSLCFSFLVLGLSSRSSAVPLDLADFYASPQVPRQEIVAAGTLSEWVLLWEEARQLSRAEDYDTALKKYDLLLEQKKGVSQARWELVSILLFQGKFDQAASELEILLENEPEKVVYLTSLGYVMYQTGHFGRSAELFELALQGEPDDILSQAGRCMALLKTGRQDLALPYLEKLSLLYSDNSGLREFLAAVYVKLGMEDKARPLVVQLAGEENPSLAGLKLAAEVHGSLGLDNLAAEYRQKILGTVPDDIASHIWLASYFEKGGRCDEALTHLHVLLQENKESAKLLLRTGNCYQKINEPATAVSYFEKYLKTTPDDKEIIRTLINLHAVLGHGDETLAALERYFQFESEPTPGNLKQAARIYDAAGRYHDAIPIYRRLLELTPNDPEVLATLAEDLLSIGADEGALKIWNQLARISPDDKEIYRSLMDLLIKLDRQKELLDVLPKLHKLDPEDDRVTLQLAATLLASGDGEQGEAVFQTVEDKEIFSAESLLLRAEIFNFLQMREHALKDYEDILRTRPGAIDLQIKCLQLAGSLGMVKRAMFHFDSLPIHWLDSKRLLVIANAFRDGFDYERAETLYRQIIVDPSKGQVIRWQAHVELAVSYEKQGLYYEADQSLRLALLNGFNNADVLSRLISLMLSAGDYDEAGMWLTQLLYVDGGSDEGFVKWNRQLLEIRRFNATKRYKAALRKGYELQVQLTRAIDEGRPREVNELERHLQLEIGKAQLGLGEIEEAERVILKLLAGKSYELASLVLLQDIYQSAGDERADRVFKESMAVAGKDLGRMLDLVGLYQEKGWPREMAGAALKASQIAPNSLNASLLHAKAHSLLGDLSHARDILNALQHECPANPALESLAAHTTFRLGFYQEALGYCDSVLARQPHRADMDLLKGRIFWTMLQWNDSLNVYENYLTPPTKEDLEKRLAGANLHFPITGKRSFWQKLLAKTDERGFVERVMSPAYVAAPENEKISLLAVPLYSKYKWQGRFARERAARQAVKKGDYFQAADLFAELVAMHPGDESILFDLAGIYSRQGRLAEEELLYKEIFRIDPDYPGLAQASERNRLKRQPNLGLAYHYGKEEGRNGYKALNTDSADLTFGTSVLAGDDIGATFSRIKYSSTENSDSIMSNRSFVDYELSVVQGLHVRVGGGVEDLENGYSDTGLVQCEVKGKVGDRVRGEVSYSRDVVNDTLASLTRNIVADNVQAGFMLGIMPRLLTGGGYDYTDYSDGNNIKGYSFWASYILFTEPTFLQLKGKYEFKDAMEGKGGTGLMLDDGFREDDHPYWTPRNYWKNSVGLFWKHKLSADTLERGKPSYYTAEYVVDYDSDGHAIHRIKGGFFIEWTKHLMVESAVDFVSSDEYRARDFTFSVVYRW